MKEKTLLSNIQIHLAKLGVHLFRNNVGTGWVSRHTVRPDRKMSVTVGPGDLILRSARPLRAGLCVGSSDLIGWTNKIVSEDMVGKQVAIFTAIEAKCGAVKTTSEQYSFIQAVNQSGGQAGIARSLEDAYEVVGGI